MNPILYKSNETDFNHRGLGTLTETIEYKVEEVLNGEFELYIEYPVSGHLYNLIEDSLIIKAKPNRKDDDHLFRIYDHELNTVSQTVSIYARSNTFDLAGNMVTDVIINNATPQQAMNTLKTNLIETSDFTFYSDITTRSSTRWTRRNALNCIAGEQGSLLQYWGGEIKRGNKWIWLYRRRGNDNVTTIRYGKDLSGLRAKYSIKGLVTAILPYYVIRDGDREETIVGNVVKSQYVNNYPVVYYDAVEFNEDDGVTDLSSLNTVASSYFTNNSGIDLPSINMEVHLIDLSHTKEYEKFKGLEEVEIGDTITVYAKKFNVNITAKVTKVVYNGNTDENEIIEIGTVRASTYEDYKNIIDRTVQPVKEQLNIVQVAANGKNKIFRGVDEPAQGMIQGDLWFKPLGSGEMEIYIFDGNMWGDPIVSTEDIEQNKRAIEQTLTDAEQDRQNTEAAITQALADAKAHADAEVERIDAELTTEIGGAIDLAEQAKADAVTKANQALADAKAHAEAEDARIKQEIGLEVDGAIEIAEQAKQDAIDLAEQSKAHAENLVAQQKTDWDTEFAAEIDVVNSTISDGIAQAKLDAENLVAQQRTDFDTKTSAIDSEVSSIKTTADEALAEIEAAATNIGHLTLSDALNALQSNAEDAHQTSLTAADQASNALIIANEFSSTARQTISDIITERGLVSGTWVNTKINEETGELSHKITQIENIIGQNIRNLVVRTGELADTYIGTNGNNSGYLNHSLSIKSIKVVPGESLTFQKETTNVDNFWRYRWLSESGQLISRQASQSNEFTVTVPANARFLEVSYPSESQPMITRGTEAKDYVLAPEDNNTQEAFQILQAEYKADLEGLESTLTNIQTNKFNVDDFDVFYQNEYSRTAQRASDSYKMIENDVPGQLITAQTRIDANAEAITRRATKQELNAVEGRVTASETLISEQAYAISLRATRTEAEGYAQSAIEGLVLGNRNYLKHSQTLERSHWGLSGSAQIVQSPDPETRRARITGTGYVGQRTDLIGFDFSDTTQSFAVSVWVYSSAPGQTIGLTLSGLNVNFQPQQLSPYVWQRYTWVFKGVGRTVGTFRFNIQGATETNAVLWELPQIEKATKVSDWIPSPTDATENITALSASLTVESDKVSSLVTRVTGTETLINSTKQTADGNVTAISNQAAQLLVVEESVEGIRTRISDAEGNLNETTALATGTQTTVSRWAERDLTNLVPNPTFIDGESHGWSGISVSAGDSTAPTTSYARQVQRDAYVSTPFVVKQGDVLYLSIYSWTLNSPHDLSIGMRWLDKDKQTVTWSRAATRRPGGKTTINGQLTVPSGVAFGQIWVQVNGDSNFQPWFFTNVDVRRAATSAQLTVLNNAITARVSTEDFNNSINVLEDAINLRVEQGDVYSQLLIDARNILFDANERIILSAPTVAFTGEAFIPSAQILELNVGKLTGTEAEFGTVRSKVLITDVIESQHLKVDNAMIDKLVVNDMTIERLFARNAFIENLEAKSLSTIEANITKIRTDLLIANVIEAKHISADTTIIDKLFSTAANIDVLTGKHAFLVGVRAVEIDAGKITSGTIETARLDASDIVTKGLTANVIKSTHLETNTATIDKLFATDAMVNRLTAKTAFIDSIKAVNIDASKITSGTIDAARIDAKLIVTEGLEVDVIEAEHLKADFAIIDKLFATEALIDRLVSKEAFIEDIQAIEISADNITAGELNSAIVNSIYLNVSNLVGYNANFIRTNWNDSVGGNVYIDGNGIHATSSTTDLQIRNGGITAIGQGDDNTTYFGINGIRLENGAFIERLSSVSDGMEWSAPGFLHLNSWGSRTISLWSGDIRFYRDLSMDNNRISNPSIISFQSSDSNTRNELYSRASDRGVFAMTGDRVIELRTGGNLKAEIGTNEIRFHRHLQMNGWEIRGQSDRRLKTNFVADEIDSLSAIKGWEFFGFNWIDSDYPQERQFGLIAQSALDIATEDEEGYLNVSMSKQLHLTSHAVQQLIKREDNTNAVASHAYLLAEQHEDDLSELKEENKKLKERVKALEGAD